MISSFARQVAEIESGKRDNVLRTGDLTARRDFSHVDDVNDAYVRLAENGKAGEAYNPIPDVCAPSTSLKSSARTKNSPAILAGNPNVTSTLCSTKCWSIGEIQHGLTNDIAMNSL